MKQIFLFLLIFFSFSLEAQDEIKWSIRYDKTSYSVVIDADISKGWHLYGTHFDESLGPIPTHVKFTPSQAYILVGEIKTSKELNVYDVNFGVNLPIFEDEAHFTQEISVIQQADLQVEVTYMLCNNERCLPPATKTLSIKVNK